MSTNLPAVGPEPRAFLTTRDMPPGHTVHYVDDDRHWPHLKPGETALVDTTDRKIAWGELYLVRQRHGPIIWQITPDPWASRRPNPDVPSAWMRPLNNPPPRRDKNGLWDITGCHFSDGPIYLDALEEQIIGRVVGLFVSGPMCRRIGGTQHERLARSLCVRRR